MDPQWGSLKDDVDGGRSLGAPSVNFWQRELQPSICTVSQLESWLRVNSLKDNVDGAVLWEHH